jgi:hypothetical protein
MLYSLFCSISFSIIVLINPSPTHFKQSDEVVYVCLSPKAYAYHNNQCRGLLKCSHQIVTMKRSKANSLGYRICKICY